MRFSVSSADEPAALRRRVQGPEHPETLLNLYNLALLLQKLNRLPEAREFAQRAFEGGKRTLGPEHPDEKDYEKLWLELKAAEKAKKAQ